MGHLQRLPSDHTLLNISLTYQGDMYQRTGNITKAIQYLEAARDTTPQADIASLGNGIQLLGRAYFRIKDINNFEREMAKSEEMTAHFDSATSSTRGHYNLGTVYEEYGRSYAHLGQMHKALEYLDQSQTNLPQTKFWELLVDTARALVLEETEPKSNSKPSAGGEQRESQQQQNDAHEEKPLIHIEGPGYSVTHWTVSVSIG